MAIRGQKGFSLILFVSSIDELVRLDQLTSHSAFSAVGCELVSTYYVQLRSWYSLVVKVLVSDQEMKGSEGSNPTHDITVSKHIEI